MDSKNLKDVLDKYGKYVIQQAKSNLTKDVNKFGSNKGGGALYNSLEFKVDTEVDLFLINFLMEDYGQFVDKGVRGKTSTYSETNAALSQFQYGSGTGKKGGLTQGINTWLKQKKFQWKDKKTGRFLSYKTMSFLIARSIYNKGLKANLFFTKPFEKGLEKLGEQIFEAFQLDVENAIILGSKK
tara:strand:- start:1024 stop:1575 length:552 start_codon:yes stop_codon:yes gene_type:complete